MGDRGFNAGGWAWMLRVWCPRCGLSFLTGNANRSRCGDAESERPTLPCRNRRKCDARAAKRHAKEASR